jgi:hypothetical protein
MAVEMRLESLKELLVQLEGEITQMQEDASFISTRLLEISTRHDVIFSPGLIKKYVLD